MNINILLLLGLLAIQPIKSNQMPHSLPLHYLDATIVSDIMNSIAKYNPNPTSFNPKPETNSLEIQCDNENDWLKALALIKELDIKQAPIDLYLYPY